MAYAKTERSAAQIVAAATRVLARHFLDNGSFNKDREGNRRVQEFAPGVLDRMSEYDWPGNVR